MPAINVATVRIEQYSSAIGAEGPLFDFTAARGKQARRAPFSRKRIEMLPAVFFGGNEQMIVTGPAKLYAAGVACHVRIGTFRRRAAVPNFPRGPGRDLRDPNRPGMRLIRLKKVACGRIAGLGRPPHKRDALAVQRPDRIAVGIGAGSEETHRLRVDIIEADEAMVAARGDEDQLRTVGRPFLRMILAAHDQLLGLLTSVYCSDPDLPIAYIGDDPLRGNFRRIDGIDSAEHAGAPGHAPN